MGIVGFFAGLAMFAMIFGAFLIGCWLDFLKHPLAWLADYWLPWGLILAGIIGALGPKKGGKP